MSASALSLSQKVGPGPGDHLSPASTRRRLDSWPEPFNQAPRRQPRLEKGERRKQHFARSGANSLSALPQGVVGLGVLASPPLRPPFLDAFGTGRSDLERHPVLLSFLTDLYLLPLSRSPVETARSNELTGCPRPPRPSTSHAFTSHHIVTTIMKTHSATLLFLLMLGAALCAAAAESGLERRIDVGSKC